MSISSGPPPSTFTRAAHLLLGLFMVTVVAIISQQQAQAQTQAATPTAAASCIQAKAGDQTPATATPFTGAACLTGTIAAGKSDLFAWTVSPADAQRLWSFKLTGAKDQPTKVSIVHVDFAANGKDVQATNTLFEFQTPNGSAVTQPPVLFAPGVYFIGLSIGNAGSYRLDLISTPLPPAGDRAANSQPASAAPVSGAFALSGDLHNGEDWYAWSLSAATAGQNWQLSLTAPVGETASLELQAADGHTLISLAVAKDGRVVLDDLGLPAGTYRLHLQPSADHAVPYALAAAPQGPRRPNAEAEPNDDINTATPWDLTHPLRGRLDRDGDRDIFRFTVDKSLAATQVDLKLFWKSSLTRKLCLLDRTGKELQCREQAGGIALSNLVLQPGKYGVSVSGADDPADVYLLRLDRTAAPQPDFETEPNDAVQTATSFRAGQTMRGHLTGDRDVEYFRLTVTGAPQLWQIQVRGKGVTALTLLDAASDDLVKRDISADSGQGQISNLFLLPGDHWLRIDGQNADYTLRAIPTGPPDPNGEREPNDDAGHSQVLAVDQTRNGYLAEADDTDVYRFSLGAVEHVAIRLTPPADGAFIFRLEWDGTSIVSLQSAQPGQPFVYDALLQPGDYTLSLSASQVSAAPYHLQVERLDPFTLPTDLEPNDTPAQARSLPPTLTATGTVGQFGDDDWYALPALTQETTLTIRQTAPPSGNSSVSYTLMDGETPLTMTPDDKGTTFQGTIPASKHLLLKVSGTGPYAFSVAFAAGVRAQPSPPTLPVTLALPGGFQTEIGTPVAAATPGATPNATPNATLNATPVATPGATPAAGPVVSAELPAVTAYWPESQRVETKLSLTNHGQQSEHLMLEATTSHYLWHAQLGKRDITIASGQSVTVPLTVQVDPDAWANQPVQIAVVARAANGAQQTVAVNMVATADATPVNSAPAWPLPKSLLGGLDLAATSLGGKPVAASDGQSSDSLLPLFDGYAPLGAGFKTPVGGLASGPVAVTVELAGDKPLPIAGITLNPAGNGITGEHLKDFDVLVSTDGTTFTQVMSGTLSPLPIEQAFVFPQPVQARFAQLRLRSNWGYTGNVILGEWKVIAQPGVVPASDRFNLADPGNGGHVVWSNPLISADPNAVGDLLTDGGNVVTLDMDPGSTSQWVVGFRDDRAARITELQWQNAPDGNPSNRFASVEMAVSTTSPLGPWQSLGTWQLKPDATNPQSFKLPRPAWARFVRFIVTATGKDRANDEFPATIRIFEQAADTSYRSILAEWGQDRQPAIYEVLVPGARVTNPTSPDNHSQADATSLRPGDHAQGQVRVKRQDDWYKIVAPPGRDSLQFTVTGSPTVGIDLAVQDQAGKPVPVKAQAKSAAETVYTIPATPGQTYYVRVSQPPHSIVFTFDTSASIGTYTNRVYQALTSFAGDVVTGEEAANFLPFGDDLLLPTWGDQPYLLQAAINNYPRTAGSSSAEEALLKATEALGQRAGTRAILIITDAETSSYQDNAKLWAALPASLPRIFSVQIAAGDDPGETRAWMQDWTAVNGGYYTYVHTQGDMDIAFDRASTWLRRPAPYTMTVSAVTLATPTPRPTPTVPPTPTPVPTMTPVPTATPLPTATATPTPTVVPTATPTPTPANQPPGGLQVLPAPAAPGTTSAPLASGVAVELILDTSGSMLQILPDGQSRIDDAKTVLTEVVTNRLPAGTPLALRVFGTVPGSCDTSLAVPLQPLDPQAAAAQINQLQVVNEVKTPIGASLQLVAQDLQGAPGPKIVVLVTDGEETCGGDPTAAIDQLIAAGFEVHVNIVGLALDDPALQQEFRSLAAKTGGSYFDAANQADLGAAIAQAVQAPYRVKNAAGQVVATGIVGGPVIPVSPGTYTIEVLTNPAQSVPNVPIQSGNTTRVTLAVSPSLPPEPPPPVIPLSGTQTARTGWARQD